MVGISNDGYPSNNDSGYMFYPLVMTNIAMENHYFLMGKSTRNGHFQ
jgi:hypothetical protein